MLLQQMGIKESQGMIDPGDLAMLYEMRNLRQARQFLVQRIKKKLEQAQKQKLMDEQSLAQTQAESNIKAEQAQLDVAKEMHKMKLEEINVQMAWTYIIKVDGAKVSEEQKRITEVIKGTLKNVDALPIGEAGPAEQSQMVPNEPVSGSGVGEQEGPQEDAQENGEEDAQNDGSQEEGGI